MAGSETSVKFTDLDPSNVYRIYIVAVTRSNITSTRSIEGKPYKEGKKVFYTIFFANIEVY